MFWKYFQTFCKANIFQAQRKRKEPEIGITGLQIKITAVAKQTPDNKQPVTKKSQSFNQYDTFARNVYGRRRKNYLEEAKFMNKSAFKKQSPSKTLRC